MFKRKTRGFTIVELLVVVGIILILAAFVTPAVSRAKSKARVAECINNIRQVGMAQIMYAQDNKNMTTSGAALLSTYISGAMPFCPEAGAAGVYTPAAAFNVETNPTTISASEAAGNHQVAPLRRCVVRANGVATFE